MPWPKPQENETEREFISRCMSNEYIQQDIPTQDQRLAVCYQQWRDRDKGGITMDLERKSFIGIELKKDKPGTFVARIATLNVVDKDGDVALPGAFPAGKTILISAYQHSSWMGALPIGKGVIKEDGDSVLVEGKFNLNTDTGKEHYETVKFAPELQEWSYGFIVQEKEEDTEYEGNHVSRILKKLDVFEASPVLRGAGIDTQILAIKTEGITFISQAETALAAAKDLADRAKSLADLRRKEGRTLSKANQGLIVELLEALKAVGQDLQKLLDATEPDSEKVRRVYLQFLKIQNEMRGVLQ